MLRTKGEGDSSFAIFPAASLALFAAVDLQRRLATATWPTPGPLRLRMVVATGDLSHRDGDATACPPELQVGLLISGPRRCSGDQTRSGCSTCPTRGDPAELWPGQAGTED